jgi:hypothetical protein
MILGLYLPASLVMQAHLPKEAALDTVRLHKDKPRKGEEGAHLTRRFQPQKLFLSLVRASLLPRN